MDFINNTDFSKKDKKITIDLTPQLGDIDIQFKCESNFARGHVPISGYSTWCFSQYKEMEDMAIIPRNLKSIKIVSGDYIGGIKFVSHDDVTLLDEDESFVIGEDADCSDDNYSDDDSECCVYSHEICEFNFKEGERLIGLWFRAGHDLRQIQFITNMRKSPIYGTSLDGDEYCVMENEDLEIVGVCSYVTCWLVSFSVVLVPKLMLIPKEIGEEKKRLLEIESMETIVSHNFGREEKTLQARPLFNRTKRGKFDAAIVPHSIDSIHIRSDKTAVYSLDFINSHLNNYENLPTRIGLIEGNCEVFKFGKDEKLLGFKIYQKKDILLGLVIVTNFRQSKVFGLKLEDQEETQISPKDEEIVAVKCYLTKRVSCFTIITATTE